MTFLCGCTMIYVSGVFCEKLLCEKMDINALENVVMVVYPIKYLGVFVYLFLCNFSCHTIDSCFCIALQQLHT